MNTLNNKVVVITGGCGQVGYTIAKRLASQGATVVAIVRRDLEDAQSKMKELSPKCYALLADVRDSISLMEAARRISHCDILINAAGYTRSIVPNKLQELTDEIFDDIIDTNLKGTFATIRAFEPFIDSGVIINISSTAGLRASQSNLAYGAAKAGIDLITKSLAKALAPKIRVVGIAPGYLINPTSGAVKPAGANEHIANITPLKRVGEAEDIADTVESVINIKHITGQTIVVDGGISL
jgi:NAD(P)-dependent dehydrogenase (short-subunit alcohol dehydrogenase family)